MTRNAFTITSLEYRLLKRIAPADPSVANDGICGTKLESLLGKHIFALLKDKVVIDFGCGVGQESVALALHGAAKVIGIDIREEVLAEATRRATTADVQDRCVFATHTDELADAVISIDSFEHFQEPAAMLELMWKLLKRGGALLASFGPTWYHPLGGHLFSVFPWAHLLFSEKALIRWRNGIRDDGATCFGEVAGGLNKMTIRNFTRIVENSPFRIDYIKAVPIRKLAAVHNQLTREFTTAVVQCKLTKF